MYIDERAPRQRGNADGTDTEVNEKTRID